MPASYCGLQALASLEDLMRDAASRSSWNRRGLCRCAQAFDWHRWLRNGGQNSTPDSFPVPYRSASRITLGRLERASTRRRGIGKLNAFHRWLFAFCLTLPQSEDARGNYSLDLHETGHRLIQSRCAMENNQVMRENMRCFLDRQKVWEAAGAGTHTLTQARTFGFGHERRALWRSV